MMAHYKTEVWLNRTRQVAQSPQDYSIRPYKTNNYYKLLEQVALSGEEENNVDMD